MKKIQEGLIAFTLAVIFTGVVLVFLLYYRTGFKLFGHATVKVEYRPMVPEDMANQDQSDFHSGFRYYGMTWDFPNPVYAQLNIDATVSPNRLALPYPAKHFEARCLVGRHKNTNLDGNALVDTINVYMEGTTPDLETTGATANEQGATYDVGGDGVEIDTSFTLGDDLLNIVAPVTSSLPAATPSYLETSALLDTTLTLISFRKTEKVEEDGKASDKQEMFHSYVRFSKEPFKE